LAAFLYSFPILGPYSRRPARQRGAQAVSTEMAALEPNQKPI
jgi:hypothetical protein